MTLLQTVQSFLCNADTKPKGILETIMGPRVPPKVPWYVKAYRVVTRASHKHLKQVNKPPTTLARHKAKQAALGDKAEQAGMLALTNQLSLRRESVHLTMPKMLPCERRRQASSWRVCKQSIIVFGSHYN